MDRPPSPENSRSSRRRRRRRRDGRVGEASSQMEAPPPEEAVLQNPLSPEENIRSSRRRRDSRVGEASSQMAAPPPEEAVLQNPLSLSSVQIDNAINDLLCKAFEQLLNRTIPGGSPHEKLQYITADVKARPPLEQPPPRFSDKLRIMQVIYLEDMKLDLVNMKEATTFLMSFDCPGEINLPDYLKEAGTKRKALKVYAEIVSKMLILLGASEYRAVHQTLISNLFERMYQTRRSYLDALWLHGGNVDATDTTKVMVFKSDWGPNGTTYLAVKEEIDQLQVANVDVEFQRLKTQKLLYSFAEYTALLNNPCGGDIFSMSGRCDVRKVVQMKFGLIHWATRSFHQQKGDYYTIWYWHDQDALDAFDFYASSLEICTTVGPPIFQDFEERVFEILCRIAFWVLEYFDCVGTRVMGQKHLEKIINTCFLTFPPFTVETFFKYATYAGGALLLSCLDDEGRKETRLTESARVVVRVAAGPGDTFYSITM